MELIDKSALVAELNRLMKWQEPIMSDSISFNAGHKAALNKLLNYLNTLEVKEVEETEQIMKECPFRQDICNRYRGTQVKCDGKCSRVVDHPMLHKLAHGDYCAYWINYKYKRIHTDFCKSPVEAAISMIKLLINRGYHV